MRTSLDGVFGMRAATAARPSAKREAGAGRQCRKGYRGAQAVIGRADAQLAAAKHLPGLPV